MTVDRPGPTGGRLAAARRRARDWARPPGRRPSRLVLAALATRRAVRQLRAGDDPIEDLSFDWKLDDGLPDELGARPTPHVLSGWVRTAYVLHGMAVRVGGVRYEVTHRRMPRFDVHDRLWAEESPISGREYLSGWWTTVMLPGVAPGESIDVELVLELLGGAEVTRPIGSVARPLEPGVAPVEVGSIGGTGPMVAICMATYRPDPDLFERQIASIRAQTHDNWVCVISDDCTPPDELDRMLEVLGDDPRFILDRSHHNRGFYRNFERALTLAPAGCDYVALADQDDEWRPHRLERLLSSIGEHTLVYSDMRLIDRDRNVLSETFWIDRENNWTDLGLLFFANTVTGAASLMTRATADRTLPFPPAHGPAFHDHWIALVAAASGSLGYVDEALYDYVQHGSNVLGHLTAEQVRLPRRPRFRGAKGSRRQTRAIRDQRSYFHDLLRLELMAQAIESRFDDRTYGSRRSQQIVRAVAHIDTSWRAQGWLAWRAATSLGRGRRDLGAFRRLFRAVRWSRWIRAYVAWRPLPRPDGQNLQSSVGEAAEAPLPRVAEHLTVLESKLQPVPWERHDDEPPRVNVVLPGIDVDHFFGGYIGKLNLALRLARSGHRVRLVAVDEGLVAPDDWRETVAGYAGLGWGLDALDLVHARHHDGPIRVSGDDRFVATTFWTAFAAHAGVNVAGRPGFLYLIQEHETMTFPMGSLAAAAEQSYRLPHRALFSTELLRDWFRQESLGVYADGTDHGDLRSLSFQNAITDVGPIGRADLDRSSRRLLFYARPEPHASRNMYATGIMALRVAIERSAIAPEWEILGVGAAEADAVPLGGGRFLQLLPRRPQQTYGRLLRACDVGLSLMYTPHPSLPPIEMASAGQLVVTNTFATKTAERLTAISGNFEPAAPEVDDLVAALGRAIDRSDDLEARVAGAKVDWARSWDDALGPQQMRAVVDLLDTL